MITLDNIAGYLTERNVWKLLHTLSGKETVCNLSVINAEDVIVEGNGFVVTVCKGPVVRDKDAVWNVGALAFYAIMGVKVFEGLEDGRQSEHEAVPRISSSHASEDLALLIYCCLNYNPALRPSMDEIHAKAASALKRNNPRPKSLITDSGKSYGESLIKFWPEEMVVILLFFMLSVFPENICAQERNVNVTEKMNAIVQRCIALRSSVNAENVRNEFSYDMDWTLLDEIVIDKDGECTVKDDVKMLGLNDICYRILKYRQGIVNERGQFVNGQDPRYKYSLIEITVKAGKSVSYEITRRQGTQTFAVISYDKDKVFDVVIEKDGRNIGNSMYIDGVCYITASEKVTPDDTFRISIVNKSDVNMSYVIVNYNARD